MTGTEKFTQEQKEQFFQEIIRLYDLADNVINAVGQQGIVNRMQQLELATPFVNRVNASTDVIAKIYAEVVKEGKSITLEGQERMEEALRNIFTALQEFIEGVEEKLIH